MISKAMRSRHRYVDSGCQPVDANHCIACPQVAPYVEAIFGAAGNVKPLLISPEIGKIQERSP
jgi:hypothetical protein